jgi:hypothetical protein
MKRRLCLVLGLCFALLIAACSGTSDAAPVQQEVRVAHNASADLPSKSAQMICSQGLRAIVQKTLVLAEPPPINSSWAGHTYTCTYALEGGPLVISVKELQDVPNAQRQYDGLVAHAGAGDTIAGVASLGLPGF